MNTEKQYRPFTIEDAKNGRQPIYRNGGAPLQWFYLDKSIDCKLISVSEEGLVHTHCDDGRIYMNDNSFDLLVEKNKVEWWVNLYKDDMGRISTGGTYTSQLFAEVNGKDDIDYFNTVKVLEEYV